MGISKKVQEKLLIYQKNEITEHNIYQKIAKTVKAPENRQILEKIADDELRHYKGWKKYTGRDVEPCRLTIWIYYIIARILGFTFAIKLMEKGEKDAQENYGELENIIPEAKKVAHEENGHEEALIGLLDEERLRYTGSMVLGLNDALVELTGALAGFTFALQNTRLIALTGSITGIAAAFSMGASEYLSTKAEDTTKNPLKASIYTGYTYIMTVIFLVLPYLIFDNYYLALACTLIFAVAIIAIFNYYISVAKDLPFKKRFLEMTFLSLGIAAFSFFIGFLIRIFLKVEI